MPLVVKNQQALISQEQVQYVEAIGYRIPKLPAFTTYEYAELGKMGIIGRAIDMTLMLQDLELVFKMFAMFTQRDKNDNITYARLKDVMLDQDELMAVTTAVGDLLLAAFSSSATDVPDGEDPKTQGQELRRTS